MTAQFPQPTGTVLSRNAKLGLVVVGAAPPPEPASAYYGNCAAARAAGAAPLYAGEPGYRAGLDRDGDGVACE